MKYTIAIILPGIVFGYSYWKAKASDSIGQFVRWIILAVASLVLYGYFVNSFLGA